MNFLEALKTGRRYKRQHHLCWIMPSNITQLDKEDIFAEDWKVESDENQTSSEDDVKKESEKNHVNRLANHEVTLKVIYCEDAYETKNFNNHDLETISGQISYLTDILGEICLRLPERS